MKKNCLVAGALGALTAIVCFARMATYAFPGESAHLQTVWKGLDVVETPPFPLMEIFAKLFGSGNVLAPVCGVLATMLLFLLVTHFLRQRMRGDFGSVRADTLARIGGIVSAVIFLLSPAVMGAATHLEPRLFDVTWALIAFLPFLPYAKASSSKAFVYPLLSAVLMALGFVDSVLFVCLLPLALAAIVSVHSRRGSRPYGMLTLFVAAFVAATVVSVSFFGLKLSDFLQNAFDEFVKYFDATGWPFLLCFATLPFVVMLFSSRRSFGEKPGVTSWIFHVAMTLASILAIATPLAPAAQMEPYAILPVATSLYAAVVAGYLAAFWWLYRRERVTLVAGGLYCFVLVVTCLWNFFVFDSQKGAFADKVARGIVDELGTRTWLVSNGMLDDHLLLAAAQAGRELQLIQLRRDLDEDYLKRLSEVVRTKNVGGSKNAELVLSLSLGVLPFVQDWFAADPSIAQDVAVFGSPDLLSAANLRPIPEFFVFGADPKRVPDWNRWREVDGWLEAPRGWGSYTLDKEENPVDRMRLSLRRHLGLVANNRGVLLQDEKRDDDAFAMYELVLQDIDRDNICSLFNELEMVTAGFQKAVMRKKELERRLKVIVDDKDRRYIIWRLGFFYGYIRNPDMFVKTGYAWARSGRPGDALSQIRRAIEFVPSERRQALMNMMAALYASDNEEEKSRRIYETILSKDATDHDALIGLMRLELLEGNQTKAQEYLEKAMATAGDGVRAKIEYAVVLLMKNDLEGAIRTLKGVLDAAPENLQAWSLLASATMQLCDTTKDAARRKALEKELENTILPEMEVRSKNPYDYYVQTTKAFLLMRKGDVHRREARDAFAAAMRVRPDMTATQDLVLGLDISLDDAEQAEMHAKDILRRNREAPLANYVMGSLALRNNDLVQAEAYLRKSANAKRATPLAMNDLAEVLRRNKNYPEAEQYARRAITAAPQMYVAWDTLAAILIDSKGDLAEAEKAIAKACELSKDEKGRESDVRMLVTLARVQLLRNDKIHARMSIRKVRSRIGELSEFEKKEFEELSKRAR